MTQGSDLHKVLPRAGGGLGRAEPLRCVHFLQRIRLSDGGVARAILDICGGLAALGHEMTILTADAEGVPAAWMSANVHIPRIVTMPLPPVFGPVSAETEACLAGADVLHLHGPWEVPCLSLARVARRLQIPYIVSTHGQLNEWTLGRNWLNRLKKKAFLALVGRRYLAGAAAVHCTAGPELAQAARYLPPGRGVVAPLPLDLSEFLELPGPKLALQAFPSLDNEIPRILYLSRLHPMKRPDLLIEAAFRLKVAGQRFRLILAGPGEARYVARLRQLACQRGLGDCILFTGMVGGSTKISLYQAATVFVLPTWQENFGYVLFEALAAATPVLTTRRADMWEELQAAGAGIVEPEPDAIAARIRPLLSDPTRAKELGQRGRAWVFRKFGSDLVLTEYEHLYRTVGSVQRRDRTRLNPSNEASDK